ncbi:Adenylate cyclase 2 [Tritonibacter multivorans]|uniref:Adenylate cyclase 2 n=1 Tax=Tritonibacter multivorans TaxID=928856 RepID=A0A0P1G7E6_9RHOB|nr:adenylate/guanylate cyclase domain-containing protein [Tritonibacter multivorans]MDA7421168.1 adenylate/guanylate cyclase domain-containing protein [Tritonibacter multivorans]CUH77589.1 Adenylate cyclase 2 [Tritonibacter multivorans]SFD34108.1 Adenylate cyclase, class 3 [Tritonibacter multivorans]
MQSKELFAREEAVITAARNRLAEPFASEEAQAQFAQLLADYEKLLKITWRFMRLSDRNEREMAAANDRAHRSSAELRQKNQELESISAKLSKYLSPQVYASIFSGKQRVELASQRKKLTVFFSDIHGFTQITDQMESEDLTELINHYLTEMAEVALEHGATIDKYMGDAVMAFFGDPESRGLQEDACACVRMALAMQERLSKLSEVWRNQGIDQPLTCRIGIHTGYCTVGNFGSAERMDYTIVGGNVNLASRLEKDAPPGGVLISHDTFALVRDEIPCEHRGPIRPRGLAYPVETYLALSPRDAAARGDGKLSLQLAHLALDADLNAMTPQERSEARLALGRVLDQFG